VKPVSHIHGGEFKPKGCPDTSVFTVGVSPIAVHSSSESVFSGPLKVLPEGGSPKNLCGVDSGKCGAGAAMLGCATKSRLEHCSKRFLSATTETLHMLAF